MKDCVVADSGPLIALARLGALALPARLWGRVLVPATVLAECTFTDQKNGAERINQALISGWLEECADLPVEEEVASFRLDAGETQAILLARRHEALLLIDEIRGRRVAARLALAHVGTCGLLVSAKRAGLISAVRPLLDDLLAAGYFLAPALVVDTIKLAGES
ncbi:MAG: DUF3368 domain-containing protein [Pseudomonadota bacterium]